MNQLQPNWNKIINNKLLYQIQLISNNNHFKGEVSDKFKTNKGKRSTNAKQNIFRDIVSLISNMKQEIKID